MFKKTKKIFLIILILTVAFSFLNCYEDEDEEEDSCTPAPSNCQSVPYENGSLTINITINDDNTSVFVRIFNERIDIENIPETSYQNLNITTKSHLISNLPTGEYSVIAQYTVNGTEIKTIDSDTISDETDSYCDNEICHSLENGEVDLELEVDSFKDFQNNQDDKCFIATAAYGSKMEKNVVILRNFRDNYLLTNKLGKLFVNNYYKYSPPFAKKIQKDENLKFLVRLFIYPIIFFIKHPMIIIFITILGVIGFRRKRKLTT